MGKKLDCLDNAQVKPCVVNAQFLFLGRGYPFVAPSKGPDPLFNQIDIFEEVRGRFLEYHSIFVCLGRQS